MADRRTQRRAARREENRTEVLDAAERVFGQDGPKDGSLRRIAAESGFSTAAIYLFFDNKQDLLVATLTRRGTELIAALRAVGDTPDPPLDKLHQIVDVAVAFFTEHPDFSRLVGHLRGGPAIAGPVLAEFAGDHNEPFQDAMGLLAAIVRDGQRSGEIRAGDHRAIAHLYSVVINEHVLLASASSTGGAALTREHFHGLIDGLLRAT